MAEDFSNEGLYRLLSDMKEEHGRVLEDISKQTRITNGRVSKLEERSEGHGRELGRLNSAVFPRPANAPVALSAPVVPGEYASLRMSPKVWTVLAAAGGILFALFLEWVKQRIAQP